MYRTNVTEPRQDVTKLGCEDRLLDELELSLSSECLGTES